MYHRRLRARREWQDIFKVMKGGKLQPRLLYETRISFRFNGEIKNFTDMQKKRNQHHQTSLTTNAKGKSLGRKHKRKEKTYKNKPKTIKKMVIGIHISIITLNINELNTPYKRHRLVEWI